MRALDAGRGRLDGCLPEGSTRIRLTVDVTGHVTFAAPADEADAALRPCVADAFAGVTIDEPAAAPRTEIIRVPRRARSASTVTSGEGAGVIASSPDAEVSAAAETPLRAALGARRDAIVTCVGATSVALVVAYQATGEVSVGIRGPLAGTDEEECVRAVLADLRADPAPGVAGSLIHAVTAD